MVESPARRDGVPVERHAVRLLFGIGALPDGKRKNLLAEALDRLLELLGDRVLPLDADAARSHTGLAVAARRAGRCFPLPDGDIAAIAASRDTSPYAAAGLDVIDPWVAP